MKGLKIKTGTFARPEGRVLPNIDYDNDHRTKQVLFGKWKFGSYLIQKMLLLKLHELHQSP